METFEEKARKVHGDKYDYSKVVYINNTTKVCIICPEHGEFWKSPKHHLHGQGCPICSKKSSSKKRTKTQEDIIEAFIKVHGNKYDYSKVEYKGIDIKVCIICPEHGEFWMTPKNHIKGQGCKKCGGKLVFNTEDFIREAKVVHGDKYDYSKVDYINTKTKVCIICPEHGEFWQRPNDHLSGKGCPVCGKILNEEEKELHKKDFIRRAIEIHGNKYSYDKVIFVNMLTPVIITCPIHGDFLQKPSVHLLGYGCSKCSNRYNYTNDEYIEKCIEIHGNRYIYTKTSYKNANEYVSVICPTHGEFKLKAYTHLQGQGCPKCRMSKLEAKTMRWLEIHGISYEYEMKYDWLKFEKQMSLDFYVPLYKIAIECQGEEHYRPVSFGSKKNLEEMFKKVVKRDKKKKELCEKHNIPLYYIDYNENVEEKLNKIFELYDNRADRAVYDYDINLTMGGAGKGQMNLDESKFHSVEMYDPEKLN